MQNFKSQKHPNKFKTKMMNKHFKYKILHKKNNIKEQKVNKIYKIIKIKEIRIKFLLGKIGRLWLL